MSDGQKLGVGRFSSFFEVARCELPLFQMFFIALPLFISVRDRRVAVPQMWCFAVLMAGANFQHPEIQRGTAMSCHVLVHPGAILPGTWRKRSKYVHFFRGDWNQAVPVRVRVSSSISQYLRLEIIGNYLDSCRVKVPIYF